MDAQDATQRAGRSLEHMALGRAVREARARGGLSQEELGNRGGLHRNYVGSIERGEINATFRTLLAVSAGLGVSLSVLIDLYERHLHGIGDGSVCSQPEPDGAVLLSEMLDMIALRAPKLSAEDPALPILHGLLVNLRTTLGKAGTDERR